MIRERIALYAAERLRNDRIAVRLDTPRQIVSKSRERFLEQRLAGLEERERLAPGWYSSSRGDGAVRAAGGPTVVDQGAITGKAETQERILAAATELFMARGYAGSTIADIAERAGVSRATVFWHFNDKAGLFREAFSRLLAPFRDSLEREDDEVDPARCLEAQLARSERFAREHLEEIAAFVRWAVESAEFRETVVTMLLDLNQRFAASLARTISDLVPAERDPKLLAAGLMLAFDADLLLSLFDASPQTAEERRAAIRAIASLLTRLGD